MSISSPFRIRSFNLNATTVDIEWFHRRGAVLPESHNLMYRPDGGIFQTIDVGDCCNHRMENLIRNTNYEIVIYGVSGGLLSDPSPSHFFHTRGRQVISDPFEERKEISPPTPLTPITPVTPVDSSNPYNLQSIIIPPRMQLDLSSSIREHYVISDDEFEQVSRNP